jgi:hypothetical protein
VEANILDAGDAPAFAEVVAGATIGAKYFFTEVGERAGGALASISMASAEVWEWAGRAHASYSRSGIVKSKFSPVAR